MKFQTVPLLTIFLFGYGTASLAGDRPDLICSGEYQQQWSLEINSQSAVYSAAAQATIQYEIRHVTKSEGQEWPRALTLLSISDTSIVLLRQNKCSSEDNWGVSILTQRQQEPVLLSGCCRERN
jgi:hypothetical protein